jgi:hypothetical protein
MSKEGKNNIEVQSTDNAVFTFVYPKSEQIEISKSDLQIQLDKFKQRILGGLSASDCLALLSLWLTVFAADFRPFFGYTSDQVGAAYVSVTILISIFIIGRPIFVFLHSWKDRERVSSDPEDMAKKILDRCQASKKT